jgi:hypothetical protein
MVGLISPFGRVLGSPDDPLRRFRHLQLIGGMIRLRERGFLSRPFEQ